MKFPKRWPSLQGPPGVNGAPGPEGPEGPEGSIIWKGAYNAGTTYGLNDGVTFEGSSYRSIQGANTGHNPALVPAYWELIALTGEHGAQGPAGGTFGGNTKTIDSTGIAAHKFNAAGFKIGFYIAPVEGYYLCIAMISWVPVEGKLETANLCQPGGQFGVKSPGERIPWGAYNKTKLAGQAYASRIIHAAAGNEFIFEMYDVTSEHPEEMEVVRAKGQTEMNILRVG